MSPAAESRIEAARQGETWAQKELAETIARFARHACTRVGTRLAADLAWEDVAQEASRKFFAVGIHQYRGKGTEDSYLYTVVKSTLVQLARGATRRKTREEATAPEEDHVSTSALQNRLDVAWILERIQEECRELLTAVFLNEIPYAQLASDLSLAESSVRAKVSRCVRRARELTA
jgi:RNA polymerase sigma factor (sigma-70 family)